jgi:hypothetical protein
LKNDIPFVPVEGVSIAIAPDDATLPADLQTWTVWLINEKDQPLNNVLIVSEGYGEHEGQPVTTSKLRYHFEEVEAHSAVKVEPIDPGLFHLTNQYWVSYYQGAQIFDKKFVFVPGTLEPTNLTSIGALEGRAGVLHS